MPIVPDCVPLRSLLEGPIQYEVPIYQRRYEWRDPPLRDRAPALRDLWDDIRTTRDRFAAGQPYLHFFGPVVQIDAGAIGHIPRHYLVDGQQRLTTVMLLLTVIRDLMRQRTHVDDATGVEALILNNAGLGIPLELRPKIRPARHDNGAMLGLLRIGGFEQDENSLLTRAYVYFRRSLIEAYVERRADEEVRQNLLDLVHVLTNCFEVVRIKVPTDDYAYEVFHSLNTKGTGLAESDKIKNLCFMKLNVLGEAVLTDVHDNLWQPMTSDCLGDSLAENDTERLDDFLRVWLWTAKRGDFGVRQLYGEFKDYLAQRTPRQGNEIRVADEAGTVRLVLEDMREYAPAYAVIREPNRLNRPTETGLRDGLRQLRHLGLGTDAYYALIEVARDYLYSPRTPEDADCAAEAVRTIKSFFIWRTLFGMGSKQQNRLFMQAGHALRQYRLNAGHITMRDVGARLRGHLVQGEREDRWPEPGELLTRLRVRQYRQRLADFVKHVLWYIERQNDREEPAGDITVEHVFPRQPDDGWRAELGEREYDVMRERVDGLCNQTLLESNEPPLQNQAGNRPFAQKRIVYAQSQIQMTRRLAGLDHWTSAEVNDRAAFLLERIRTLWPRPEIPAAG